VIFLFTHGQLKKCQINVFAELDWGGGYFGRNFFLRGCKSNRKFYWGENRKWHILQGWKTLLTL